MKIYTRTVIDLQSLMIARPVRRSRRPEYLLKQEILNRAWELYSNNVLDFKDFLEFVNQMMKMFF